MTNLFKHKEKLSADATISEVSGQEVWGDFKKVVKLFELCWLKRMAVIFGPHAEEKFRLFEERGFPISREQVLDCIEKPDRIGAGHNGRLVAQKRIDEEHVLRVIYLEKGGVKRVITFYPGRRERYEN